MKHYIYKITNTKNGMIYVGYHKTKNQNDSYLGSGSKIREAVKEFGENSFFKEILFEFSSREEALAKEKELVTKEFVALETTYNMIPGGHGGFDCINSSGIKKFHGKKHTPEAIARMSRKGHVVSEETKEKLRKTSKAAAIKRFGSVEATGDFFRKVNTGKPKSEETKKKIAEAVSKSYEGRILVCPYCNLSSKSSVMYRFHFDKCKAKSLL